MHGAAFFCFRVGRGRGKILGAGRETVKLGAFSGRGRAVLKVFGAGAVRAAIFPGAGAGRGGACIPDLPYFKKVVFTNFTSFTN